MLPKLAFFSSGLICSSPLIYPSLFFFLSLVQVSAESASQFGELVADPVINELLHYTEKPETFVCTKSKIQLLFFSLALPNHEIVLILLLSSLFSV